MNGSTIKFKAWDGKKIIDDWLVITEMPGESIRDIHLPKRQAVSQLTVSVQEKMQFTGLSDDSGEEIYLGYIAECEVMDDKGRVSTAIGEVCFDEFEIVLNTNSSEWPSISWKCVVSCKIIGNKFENPELLEDEDE